MNLEKIKECLADQRKYRVQQAMRSIFVDLVDSWDQNTTLPLALREKLNAECPLRINAELFPSKQSESVKALLQLEDNNKIETVLMLHEDGRRTVCVSSQVGCAMGCKFCATGTMGRIRNLTASEIVEQVVLFARYVKNANDGSPRITNIVFMGMGEPFMNYDNVMAAIMVMNDAHGLQIGVRHISVSTSGVIDGIKRFTKEPVQVNLAISIHAADDALRSTLMPINRLYPLKELMKAVADYVKEKKRRVMFQYLMLDGVNDSEECALKLAKLMRTNPLYMVNIIRYNPTGPYEPSTIAAIQAFKDVLMREGVMVTQRQTFGLDVNAACGQLVIKKQKTAAV